MSSYNGQVILKSGALDPTQPGIVPGTIVVDPTAGTARLVAVVGGVKALLADPAQGVAQLGRSLGVTVTPGAGASGAVDYLFLVGDAAGNVVPNTVVGVSWKGAAADVTPSLDGGSEFGSEMLAGPVGTSQTAFYQTGLTGTVTAQLTGTPGNTITVTGFVVGGGPAFARDAGRVLP